MVIRFRIYWVSSSVLEIWPAAVAWVKENSDLINGDQSKIVLFGSSSGAHLSSLHGLSPYESLLDGCEYSASLNVLAVVSLSGAYDFDLITNGDSRQALREMLLNRFERFVPAQPIEQVKNQTSTKFLILHGETDGVVGTEQPFPFSQALQDYGYCVEATIFENRKHDLMKHLGDLNDPVRIRVLNYVDSLFNDLKCGPGLNSTKSENREMLKIYPNPISDFLVISNSFNSEIKDIFLYDLAGKLLIHQKASDQDEYILNLDKFPDGIYVTQVLFSDNKIISKKINKVSVSKKS